MVGACLLKNRQIFAHKNTRRIVAIFITNCAFKSRVFYLFNHLYTPCRTGNTTFYKLVVMQMPLDGRRVFAEKLTNSLVLILSRNTGASWKSLSQIVPSKAECFAGLISFSAV